MKAISHLLMLCLFLSCGPTRLQRLQREQPGALLLLPPAETAQERSVVAVSSRDTLRLEGPDGVQYYRMKAVKDTLTGEVMAGEVLEAAIVQARSRNIAERHGRVDLRFEVVVPQAMQDSRWQLRFYPDLFVLEDSLRLEPVLVTGKDYRTSQLRGYQQYRSFVSRIITDSTQLVDLRSLEVFLQRNLPEVYRFRDDSSFVSDEAFRSAMGVSEQEAVSHYTNRLLQRLNERRIARKDKMYRKYVKVPIVTEGIRLDTVMQSVGGDFVYHYRQTLQTRPGLRRADVVLQGDIWEGNQRIYSMARTEPLSFYISSLSAFVDDKPRYLTRIVERRAASNVSCRIAFRPGRWAVDAALDDNQRELERIRGHVGDLLGNDTFEVDSIVISASASPEGPVWQNKALSLKRAGAVAEYFREQLGEGLAFRSRSLGENWEALSLMVDTSGRLNASQKAAYSRVLARKNLDERERALKREDCYPFLRDSLYPLLRTVRFDFFLHRKGMVRDTLHTTEIDSVYASGVALLKDRSYEQALEVLRPYRDYNTALTLVSLDYNASAMAILQSLEKSPPVEYLLALLHARNGDDAPAVQHYLAACRADPSYVFRGNLDPEIHTLIERYGLHQEK